MLNTLKCSQTAKNLLLLLLPVLLFSCFRSKRGSGNIIKETRNVAAFNAIDVGGSIDVELTQGTKNEVIVEADDNLIKYVEVVNKAGVLSINIKYNGSLNNFTARVKITSPVYTKISASASSEVTSTNVITSADKITVDANSSADVELNIDAPMVVAEASSSANVKLQGKTKQLDATASSSGDLNAEKLLAETVKAEASSSGSLNVFASVKLIADANSSGDVHYIGGVKDIQKSESSSGSVSAK
jgi:hypothetical protein